MARYATPDDFYEANTAGIPRVAISVPGFVGTPDLVAQISDDGVYEIQVELATASEVWGPVHRNNSEGSLTLENNSTREVLTAAADIESAWSSMTVTPARTVDVTNGSGGADNYTLFHRYPLAANYRAKRVVRVESDGSQTDLGPHFYAGATARWRYFYQVFTLADGASLEVILQEHRTGA